jgi:hypothetical protein
LSCRCCGSWFFRLAWVVKTFSNPLLKSVSAVHVIRRKARSRARQRATLLQNP